MTKEAKKTDEPKVTAQHVHIAVNQVKAALAKTGISKDRNNSQQGYKFRGIDDVYNALAPVLADASLNVYPNVLKREVVERTNQKGTALFYVTVEVRFDFVSAVDGSTHAVVTYGEAMDSGDKATNKAMSAALKYAFMQTFCIPTEGDNDADATTHEVKSNTAHPLGGSIRSHIDEGQEQEFYNQALRSLDGAMDLESLKKVWAQQWKTRATYKPDHWQDIEQKYNERKKEFPEAQQINGVHQ